jgi:hypothetical protein
MIFITERKKTNTAIHHQNGLMSNNLFFFSVASILKTFIAVAVMQLVEAKRVWISTRISISTYRNLIIIFFIQITRLILSICVDCSPIRHRLLSIRSYNRIFYYQMTLHWNKQLYLKSYSKLSIQTHRVGYTEISRQCILLFE